MVVLLDRPFATFRLPGHALAPDLVVQQASNQRDLASAATIQAGLQASRLQFLQPEQSHQVADLEEPLGTDGINDLVLGFPAQP